MHLKSIKLAGFKSFVDPTTVTFPGNLCGVVGPNGCGKSNIIDAVRWVMGESSAKQLRGDSMADVIFNGSSDRQPVGQASIELIFDNSSGRITGEYAAYNEISVKRKVQRDGSNDYSLNGSKCRRRDITDIFLGTGLGARSYSIIEQGMISNLITAKPEDLRIYIEEAAGISKYKERRRDTENRIRRTRENLERLTDIRDELQRQLQKLQRQAKAAEKFRQYKTEQRELSKQLQALQWKHFDTIVETEQQQLSSLNVELEKRLAAEAKVNAALEKSRVDFNERNQQLSTIQAEYYSEGAEISQLEQAINHNKQRNEQLLQEQTETQQALADITQDLEQDVIKIDGWSAEIEQLEEQLNNTKQSMEASLKIQSDAEQQMQQWQREWDSFAIHYSEVEKQTQIEKSSIEHQELLLKRHADNSRRLDDEMNNLKQAREQQPLQQEFKMLMESQQGFVDTIASLKKEIESVNQFIQQYKQQQTELSDNLNTTRVSIQQKSGQQASLKALQESAVDKTIDEFLKQTGLDTTPQLYDQLKVKSGWEMAVEAVLGSHLHARCVDNINDYQRAFGSIQQSISLLQTQAGDNAKFEEWNNMPAMSRVLTGNYPQFVDSIYLAESLEQALLNQSALNNSQSIVTKQGQWLGANWLITYNANEAQSGVIKRQQEIESLESQLKQEKQHENDLLSQLSKAEQLLTETEAQRQQQQQSLNQQIQNQSNNDKQITALNAKLEQWQYQHNKFNEEHEVLQEQIKLDQEKLQQARENISELVETMAKLSDEREQRLQQKQQIEQAVKASREKARESGSQYNQLALRERTVQTQIAALKDAGERLNEQLQRSQQRMQSIQKQLREEVQPDNSLQQQLESKLKQRIVTETRLSSVRNQTSEIENSIRDMQIQLQKYQAAVQEQRESIQQQKVTAQETITLRKGIVEAMQSLNIVDITDYLKRLNKDITVESSQQQIDKIERRVQQLGAVNLAAIEEYESEQERKQYLDEQNKELEDALNTLESVMRKIDKETRTRFKETFEQINTGFKMLFPKLFGGGHAYLELTSDDLLNTGISIIARPPGKRNSTIHLLSGGEKALAAIAMVFAIFQLNPAPFCMLDEVDAPLDDANIGRFAEMVKKMSEKVQFIFISHNKATIEMANQLMGVTMQEAGVSRVVSVNVEDAIEMVG